RRASPARGGERLGQRALGRLEVGGGDQPLREQRAASLGLRRRARLGGLVQGQERVEARAVAPRSLGLGDPGGLQLGRRRRRGRRGGGGPAGGRARGGRGGGGGAPPAHPP